MTDSRALATPASALQLVPALPEDAPALRDRAVESFLDDYAAYGAKPPGIEDVAFHAERASGGDYFRILSDDVLAGGILIEPTTRDTAEIALFYVAPTHQNRGIGAGALALIERRYSHIAIWRLGTPSSDTRNRHFYERHGYRRKGTTTPPDGRGPTLIRYEKRVDPEPIRA